MFIVLEFFDSLSAITEFRSRLEILGVSCVMFSFVSYVRVESKILVVGLISG